ncbi:MAG: hypothetical protein GF353_04690 [Candidatus Lokiarchaeota archaeon]|nr:hypothetical protein [Candidatus Lokiarchaeota archaeon]
MQSDQHSEEILSVLQSIEKWIKITSIPRVKEILELALPTTETKKIYNYSDGRSQKEIAELANVTQPTVSNYWKKWIKIGIVKESPKYKGRYEKSFMLEDFDIKAE